MHVRLSEISVKSKRNTKSMYVTIIESKQPGLLTE